MDNELEALIKEQQADLRRGSFQPHEPHVSFSLDKLSYGADANGVHFETWDNFVSTFDEDGVLHIPNRHPYEACPIHGNKEITISKGNRYRLWCRACERDREYVRRRMAGKLTRAEWDRMRGTKCGHDPSERRANGKGHTRCRICTNERQNERRARQRAEAAMKARTDPVERHKHAASCWEDAPDPRYPKCRPDRVCKSTNERQTRIHCQCASPRMPCHYCSGRDC